jgi:hypothetical protein
MSRVLKGQPGRGPVRGRLGLAHVRWEPTHEPRQKTGGHCATGNVESGSKSDLSISCQYRVHIVSPYISYSNRQYGQRPGRTTIRRLWRRRMAVPVWSSASACKFPQATVATLRNEGTNRLYVDGRRCVDLSTL